MLDERIRTAIIAAREEMTQRDDLLPRDRLQACYGLFRTRFGLDVLQGLDGEELLNTMHAHGSHDSIVYWLEFKDDDEFPAVFGSIAGGSALKFGIYLRKETGIWMTGSPQNQREITDEEAIEIARRHRDQLVAGAGLLEALPEGGSDSDYADLQQQLDDRAPDVSRAAWGHKYFSLLYPDKLDDFHSEMYQRFHLIKLLQVPPQGTGRYLAAGRFIAISRELGFSVNHLTSILNYTNGRPYRIWRIATSVGEGPSGSLWPVMQEKKCVMIGWPLLGDLSQMSHNKDSKDHIRELLQDQYAAVPNIASRKAGEILNFVSKMEEGDLVLAASGDRILGIGRIAGPYQYDPRMHEGAPHWRPVAWLTTQDFRLPTSEGLQTTVYQIRKSVDNLIDIERRVVYAETGPVPPVKGSRLDGIPGRVQAILERKGQVILYGPPGTGKTYWARRAGLDLAALRAYGKRFDDLSQDQRQVVEGSEKDRGLLRVCTFHPAYGYEDFIEGYRPREGDGGSLLFTRVDGIFKRMCANAEREPDKQFFLLVDEINRGDIPRIFGELLTLLEKDKRGQSVYLPVSGDRFSVPGNVYILGTMNTADRSIALLDTALRRRFGFIELMPDPDVLGNTVVGESIPLGPWLAALNGRLREHIGRDARNLQVGHAYLLQGGSSVSDFSRFVRILADDILPLLEEYCYEDYAALAQILGKGLVDESRQRIRDELLAPDRRDELIQALLAPCPEIATSREVVALAEQEEEPEEETDKEDEIE
jgi:5-methylcytosine-specific restriction protein B